MNRERKKAEEAFLDYTAQYDPSDVKIRLKIDHTLRVAKLSERIAKSLKAEDHKNAGEGMEPDPAFAWFLGLLHDIGRFEQVKRYGTFVDRKSVDHAELGADLLFSEGLLLRFPAEGFMESVSGDWQEIAEKAIRLHNKLAIPGDLDQKTALYCNILRDADKCDIFRVLTEPPFDRQSEEMKDGAIPAREIVMECIREHRCIPRTFDTTLFESLFTKCAMAFELVYPESRRIAVEQGYLSTLLSVEIKDPVAREQLSYMKQEISSVMGSPVGN